MKTVCKKLLSVMLVAMLLVSAIPFQAAAEGGTIIVTFKENGTVVKSSVSIDTKGDTVRVGDLYWYHYVKNKSDSSNYEFSNAYVYNKDGTKGPVGKDDVLTVADVKELHINMNYTASTTPTEAPTTPTTPTLVLETPNTTVNKFPYNVYLHIYLNNKVDVPAKTINITENIAIDGVVSRSEVENTVRSYYNAQNSKGLAYDGLYLAKGNWVSNFSTDSAKYDQVTGILEARKEYEIHINVMVTNAVAKTTTTTTSSGVADSTNPKTGDTILGAVAALGLSVSALAALCYVTNKKRFF